MSNKSTNCNSSLSVALKLAKGDPTGPKVTRDTIAEDLQISPTQAGRVLDGLLDDIVIGLNHALQSDRHAIYAGELLCGTAYPLTPSDANADVDGNGVIDKRDVFGGGITALQHVTDQLTLAQSSGHGTSYTPQQAGEIRAAALKAIQILTGVMVAADKLTLSGGPMRVAV